MLAVAAAVLLTTGSAVPPVPRAALAGLVAGTPVDCIDRLDIDSVATVRGAIVYTVRGGRTVYYNVPTTGARLLDPATALLVDPAYPQLCRGEIVRALSSASRRPLGIVTLGPFIPYVRP